MWGICGCSSAVPARHQPTGMGANQISLYTGLEQTGSDSYTRVQQVLLFENVGACAWGQLGAVGGQFKTAGASSFQGLALRRMPRWDLKILPKVHLSPSIYFSLWLESSSLRRLKSALPQQLELSAYGFRTPYRCATLAFHCKVKPCCNTQCQRR